MWKSMEIEALPLTLPDDVLALRESLPVKPQPVILTGTTVRLVPVDVDRDAAELYAISNGNPCSLGARSVESYDAEELIWRFMLNGPFPNLESFVSYLRTTLETKDVLPFCVRDLATDHPIGFATFMNNVPAHLKIELGGIWYSPLAQGTPANTEATYLMLDHAFHLGYRRVEWKCHSLNQRSRRAALRMGFRFEGIQESHVIIKGRNRDTAWFRVLQHEWPEVKLHLEGLLRKS